MTAKIFQTLGVLVSIGGLVGDEVLKQWDNQLRALIEKVSKFEWALPLIDWAKGQLSRLRNSLANIVIALIPVIVVIGFIIVFLLNAYQEGLRTELLVEAQRSDPEEYTWSTIIVLILMVAFLGIVVVFQKIFDDLKGNSPKIYKIFAGIGQLFKWLVAGYILVVQIIIFGGVAIILFSPIIIVLLVGFIVTLPIIFLFVLGFLLIRLALLPYLILDKLASGLKLKSTVLFIGVVLEVFGIWLD